MPRRDLYPSIEPYQNGFLRVDEVHTLYWEQCGNPKGAPILFLHGGPGAGCSATHRRFFDPSHYRIVLVDQRGAGRSSPLGDIRHNTTEHLIDDLEHLRRVLGVDGWLLFGGSWGSTLALAYAQTHPDRVTGLILRGIFLMRRWEIDWFLYRMGMIFPEAWSAFSGFLPQTERSDLLEGYWRRLNAGDATVRLAAARSWSVYEGACSSLLLNPDLLSVAAEDSHALGLARIECHYFRNNLFQPEDKLLRDIARIRGIPAVIIHGRYDIICPIVTAAELHRCWPEADYQVVPDAGHSAMEPSTRIALIAATERFKRLV